MRTQQWEQFLGHVQCTEEISPDSDLSLLSEGYGGSILESNSCIVHKYIKAPVAFFKVVPKSAYAVQVINVKLMKLWMKLHLIELRHGFMASFFISSCQVNITIKLLTEEFHNGQSNSFVSSSNHGDSARCHGVKTKTSSDFTGDKKARMWYREEVTRLPYCCN